LGTSVIWQRVELCHMKQQKYWNLLTLLDCVFFIVRIHIQFQACACIVLLGSYYSYVPISATLTLCSILCSLTGICRWNRHSFYGDKCKGFYKCRTGIYGNGFFDQGQVFIFCYLTIDRQLKVAWPWMQVLAKL
jgi:hypothetical protein